MYFAKWEATNKNYIHPCIVKKNPTQCPEVLRAPSSRPVCRKNLCILMSDYDLFHENKKYVTQLKTHPLIKRDQLNCPKGAGDLYLALPTSANGIQKEQFFFKNLLTKDGLASGLNCYYRIKDRVNSYVKVGISFQIIGENPIISHFCKRKEFKSASLELFVNKKYAITQSFKKYIAHKEKPFDITLLKKSFKKIENIIQDKYAINCI